MEIASSHDHGWPFITNTVITVADTTYFVIPDHYSLHNDRDKNTFTLQHYLNNTDKYFVSHNQLHFLPGQYYINSDLTFSEINDFTLTGHAVNQSYITCSSPASIVVAYVEHFTLQNISLFNCMTLTEVKANSYYISIYFYLCGSIFMHNLYVNINISASSAPAPLSTIFAMNVAKSRISQCRSAT